MSVHSENEKAWLREWVVAFSREPELTIMVDALPQRGKILASSFYPIVRQAEHVRGIRLRTENILCHLRNPRASLAAELIKFYKPLLIKRGIELNIGAGKTEPMLTVVAQYEADRIAAEPWLDYDIEVVRTFIIDFHVNGVGNKYIINLLVDHAMFPYPRNIATSTVNSVVATYICDQEKPDPELEFDPKPAPEIKVRVDDKIQVGDWCLIEKTDTCTMSTQVDKAYKITRIQVTNHTTTWLHFRDDNGDLDYHALSRFTKTTRHYDESPTVQEEQLEPTNQIIQEPIMANTTNITVNVVTAAFATKKINTIYGVDVASMDEADLFKAIRQISADQEALKDLGAGQASKRITAKIASLKAAKISILKAIDELPEDV